MAQTTTESSKPLLKALRSIESLDDEQAPTKAERKQEFTFDLDGRKIDAKVVDGELRLYGDGTLCIQPRSGNAVYITLS